MKNLERKRKSTEFLSSNEMLAVEMNAEYLGLSRLQMMENAGSTIAKEICNRFTTDSKVAIFTGIGGNGGDGFVTARHLSAIGFDVLVVLVGRPELISNYATSANWEILKTMKDTVKLVIAYDSSLIPEYTADVYVDSLLGIGVKGALRPPILQAVKKLNEFTGYKIAIDVPSGVESDAGLIENDAFKADLTITFHKVKPGLLKAKEYVGELIVENVGIPSEAEYRAGPGDVFLIQKPRRPESHKGDFGRLLVIGGNETYTGAPALVALAALRTGIDITYIAAPNKTARDISSISPDLITIKLKGEHLNSNNITELIEYIEKVDAVVAGPGLGTHNETVETINEIIPYIEKSGKALLLDADAIKSFSQLQKPLKTPTVFTPHRGEFKTLTGIELPIELRDKIKCVEYEAEKLGVTILLKGHEDIISDGNRTKINLTGNPGMTVGGTGDVLAGIVGGFLAQGIEPFKASVAGAFVNGAAGDFSVNVFGFHIKASDLIDMIPSVIDDPMFHKTLIE